MINKGIELTEEPGGRFWQKSWKRDYQNGCEMGKVLVMAMDVIMAVMDAVLLFGAEIAMMLVG